MKSRGMIAMNRAFYGGCLVVSLAFSSNIVFAKQNADNSKPEKTASAVQTPAKQTVKSSAPPLFKSPNSTPPKTALGPPLPGYELQQWQRIAGQIRMEVNKYGGRFETTHYTLMKPLPGPNMYFMNVQTKKYVLSPMDQWREKFTFYHREPASASDRGFTPFSPWKKIGVQKICGLSAVGYTRMRTNQQPAPNDKTYTEEWWFADKLPVPPDLVEMYRKSFVMKYDSKLGFPLRIREIREWYGKKQRKVEISYDTISFKKASFPQSMFVVPEGYKKVKDEMSVLMEGGDSMMDPLTPGTGVSADLEEALRRRSR